MDECESLQGGFATTFGASDDGSTCYFRAGGGAMLPLTAAAAVLRHRAALHVHLVAACLNAGLADQAGMCLRQLCGALNGTYLPAAAVDPAPRAIVCRAIAAAAAAWLNAACRCRAGGPDASMKGVEKLTKDGESALLALGHEAARMGNGGVAAVGTSGARAMGAVAAEAAAAAAALWVALVAGAELRLFSSFIWAVVFTASTTTSHRKCSG